MRILFITQASSYINPTNELFVRELGRRPGVILAGPGFDEDYRSVRALARRHGEFDLVVADFWAKSDYYKWFSFPMVDDLWDYGAPVIISGMMMDVHTLPEELLVGVMHRADAVVTTAISPQIARDWFAAGCGDEDWFHPDSFAAQHLHLFDERFVLMPHCLAEDEFRPVDWRRKRHDVTVPGAGYGFRRRVRAGLETSRFKVARLETLFHKLLAYSFNYPRLQPELARRLYRERFVDIIARSRVAVTCDGTIGYPLRKFFEIPAYGTVLAAKFFEQPEALGFREGETAFFLDDHGDRLDEILEFATRDGAAAQRVAQAGQDMVRARHTVGARIDQFLDLAEAVAARDFGRARWEDGRFVVERKRS